jgi:hypothetical protein
LSLLPLVFIEVSEHNRDQLNRNIKQVNAKTYADKLDSSSR